MLVWKWKRTKEKVDIGLPDYQLRLPMALRKTFSETKNTCDVCQKLIDEDYFVQMIKANQPIMVVHEKCADANLGFSTVQGPVEAEEAEEE